MIFCYAHNRAHDFNICVSLPREMKERLNLTIDGALLEAIKVYAASRQTSVSELVEDYFQAVTREVPSNTIVDLMDRLERPTEERTNVVKKVGGYGT